MQAAKPTLLIVDDDKLSIKRYTDIFTSFFQCLSTTDGEAGIDIFEDRKPEVVLCDVKLPGGISGFEVCRRIKNEAPNVIVILISNYEDRLNRIKGYELRADDFVNKMLSEEETYFKVINTYSTKYNVSAILPSVDHTCEGAHANVSIENAIREIIFDFYNAQLQERKATRLSLDHVAKKLSKSKRTIQREFSKNIGTNFIEYHNRIKMELACKLLIQNSSHSISDISDQLGFSTPSNFSREFKLLIGVTPSKYRSNNLN